MKLPGGGPLQLHPEGCLIDPPDALQAFLPDLRHARNRLREILRDCLVQTESEYA